MRIGIGSTKLEPSLTQGRIDGIGVYVQSLLEQYHELGHDVLSVSYPPLQKPWQKPVLPKSTKFSTPYSFATAAAFTPFGTLLNASLEKNIDLFHATDYLIPRFRNIPVVATLHDAIMLKHPDWCNGRFRKLKNSLIKHSLAWSDHVITISKAMMPDVVECWGVNENKISIVHQGISDGWLEKVSDKTRQIVLNKFNIQGNYVLSVGTLQPRKNFSRIIKAYELLPQHLQKEFKLVLVGKDGWQSTEIRQDILRMVSENKALWLQYVTLEELRVLYQSAKLLLFPSLSEGFGYPVLEGFASNIPVLTSNTTSLPEIAGDAAYLVDPYNVEEICHGIKTLLNNPALCSALINKGQVRVQQFTLEKCARETLNIYKMLSK